MRRAAGPGRPKASVSLAGFAALAAALLARPVLADETLTLDSVFATLAANGSVEYRVTGHLRFVEGGLTTLAWGYGFVGTGIYNPATRQAAEELQIGSGSEKTRTRATCFADPWLIGGSCSNGQILGFDSDAFPAPISASRLSAEDRNKVKTAFEFARTRKAEEDAAAARAEAARLAAEAAKKKKEHDSMLVTAVGSKGNVNSHVADRAFATPTPAIVKRKKPSHDMAVVPPYGAEYVAGSTPVRSNQIFAVPVSIKNLGSQNWPANGGFQLSYHWTQGANVVVLNGERTLLPTLVAPGGAVAVTARLKGPPAPGVYTLKWDMVDGTTWFSTKGVPTKDQYVTVTP